MKKNSLALLHCFFNHAGTEGARVSGDLGDGYEMS